MSNNIVWQNHPVDQSVRAEMKSQKPVVLWFTGLSASGKSTLAGAMEQILTRQGYHTYLLDGDNIRHGLCGDLGFSDKDRQENIRRVGEVARLMVDSGLIVMAAFISPFKADRRIVRNMMPAEQFLEVFVDTSLDICKSRDPKGLYKKVAQGEIKQFTGIDSPYEPPENPDLSIDAGELNIHESVNMLLEFLHARDVLKAGFKKVAETS